MAGPTKPEQLAASGHRGPMTPRELTAWAKRLAATAVELRAERGECPPTALVVVNRVPFSLDIVLRSEEDKQTLRQFFEVAARGAADACALVAEGWRFGGNKRKLTRTIRHALEGGSLVSLRGRQEILFVHAVSAQAADLRLRHHQARRAPARGGGPSASGVISKLLTGLPWASEQQSPRRPAGARSSRAGARENNRSRG